MLGKHQLVENHHTLFMDSLQFSCSPIGVLRGGSLHTVHCTGIFIQIDDPQYVRIHRFILNDIIYDFCLNFHFYASLSILVGYFNYFYRNFKETQYCLSAKLLSSNFRKNASVYQGGSSVCFLSKNHFWLNLGFIRLSIYIYILMLHFLKINYKCLISNQFFHKNHFDDGK